MLNTTITQFGTDYPYKMEVYYNKGTGTWILSFACLQPGHMHGEEHSLRSFGEALRHFNANCRYYGVPEQYCTEEQFLGLKEGTLYPKEAI